MSRSLSTVIVAILVALAVGGLAWDFATGGAVSQMTTGSSPAQAPSSRASPRILLPKSASVPAPDLQLRALGGQMVSLRPRPATGHRVVLVNFWATWCPPCRREIPDLIELQQALGKDGLRVVGISLDRDRPAGVRRFVATTGINYPVVLDDGRAAEAFGGVPALPVTYIIGGDGLIRGRVPGLVTRETLAPILRELLGSRSS